MTDTERTTSDISISIRLTPEHRKTLAKRAKKEATSISRLLVDAACAIAGVEDKVRRRTPRLEKDRDPTRDTYIAIDLSAEVANACQLEALSFNKAPSTLIRDHALGLDS